MNTRKHQWSFLFFSLSFFPSFSVLHILIFVEQLVHIATACLERRRERKENGPRSGLNREYRREGKKKKRRKE
jgi:hypothetical protein